MSSVDEKEPAQFVQSYHEVRNSVGDFLIWICVLDKQLKNLSIKDLFHTEISRSSNGVQLVFLVYIISSKIGRFYSWLSVGDLSGAYVGRLIQRRLLRFLVQNIALGLGILYSACTYRVDYLFSLCGGDTIVLHQMQHSLFLVHSLGSVGFRCSEGDLLSIAGGLNGVLAVVELVQCRGEIGSGNRSDRRRGLFLFTLCTRSGFTRIGGIIDYPAAFGELDILWKNYGLLQRFVLRDLYYLIEGYESVVLVFAVGVVTAVEHTQIRTDDKRSSGDLCYAVQSLADILNLHIGNGRGQSGYGRVLSGVFITLYYERSLICVHGLLGAGIPQSTLAFEGIESFRALSAGNEVGSKHLCAGDIKHFLQSSIRKQHLALADSLWRSESLVHVHDLYSLDLIFCRSPIHSVGLLHKESISEKTLFKLV